MHGSADLAFSKLIINVPFCKALAQQLHAFHFCCSSPLAIVSTTLHPVGPLSLPAERLYRARCSRFAERSKYFPSKVERQALSAELWMRSDESPAEGAGLSYALLASQTRRNNCTRRRVGAGSRSELIILKNSSQARSFSLRSFTCSIPITYQRSP